MKMVVDPTTEAPFITPEGAERRVLSHGGGMMAVEFRFPAGVIAPIHHHPHEQIGYVVSGEVELIIDGQESQRLTAGCSYYIPPNVRHGVITLTPTVLFDCFTPIREDFLR